MRRNTTLRSSTRNSYSRAVPVLLIVDLLHGTCTDCMLGRSVLPTDHIDAELESGGSGSAAHLGRVASHSTEDQRKLILRSRGCCGALGQVFRARKVDVSVLFVLQ